MHQVSLHAHMKLCTNCLLRLMYQCKVQQNYLAIKEPKQVWSNQALKMQRKKITWN